MGGEGGRDGAGPGDGLAKPGAGHAHGEPVGGRGVAMVDVRDVGEVAALELIRREQATEPFPAETIEVCGPEALTGHDLAAIWSEALGRQVNYGGDDLAAFDEVIIATGVTPRIPELDGIDRGGGFGAVVEGVERRGERGAAVWWKADIEGLLAPARPAGVDGEAELARDRHERVLVGGMQPLAAEVERDTARERHRVAAPPDAVACLEDQD